MVIAAFFLVGKTPEPDEYITRQVRRGDTLNGIAEEYYELNKPGVMCFEEYVAKIRKINSALQNSNRVLQIGDEVKGPVYKK